MALSLGAIAAVIECPILPLSLGLFFTLVEMDLYVMGLSAKAI